MMNPVFKYIADLPREMGRPMGMCNFRGDILVAMEHGQLLLLEEDTYLGQISYKEIPIERHK